MPHDRTRDPEDFMKPSKSIAVAKSLAELKRISEPRRYVSVQTANDQGFVTIEQYVKDAYDKDIRPPISTQSKAFRRLYLEDKLDRITIKDGPYIKWGYRVKSGASD